MSSVVRLSWNGSSPRTAGPNASSSSISAVASVGASRSTKSSNALPNFVRRTTRLRSDLSWRSLRRTSRCAAASSMPWEPNSARRIARTAQLQIVVRFMAPKTALMSHARVNGVPSLKLPPA
jgi:hypothetical protein